MSVHTTRSLFRHLAAAVAASTALWLAGCSTPTPQAATDAPQWQGRMGLQVHDDAAQAQSFSASFHLEGDAQVGSLHIFNPLGSQVAQLQWQPGMAWLRQGNQSTTSASLDDLLKQSLGHSLPVAALFQWLQGQPASAPGWHVDLSRHAQGRITAQRSTPTPQATLRVVLEQP